MFKHAAIAFVLGLTVFVCTPVHATQSARRIVSLAPNLTELVYSAGAGAYLVGVDSMSDFPEAARRVQRVGDAFQVDYERIITLKPDLVLVWTTGTPEPVIARLQQLKLRVERITIASLDDVAKALRHIGALTGSTAIAQQAATTYLQDLAKLRTSRVSVRPLSVFYEISTEPLYTVSGKHPISEIITLCGGRNIFNDLPQLAPPVSVEAVIERDPQVILTATGAKGDPLELWKRWPKLRAVRTGNLYTLNADHLARATVRIVKGAREVCSVLDEAREKQ